VVECAAAAAQADLLSVLEVEAVQVFIRALTAAGENKDTNFVLSGVSEIRKKIGARAIGPARQMRRRDRLILHRNANRTVRPPCRPGAG